MSRYSSATRSVVGPMPGSSRTVPRSAYAGIGSSSWRTVLAACLAERAPLVAREKGEIEEQTCNRDVGIVRNRGLRLRSAVRHQVPPAHLVQRQFHAG